MSIERAVHKLTYESATLFGIKDRGRLAQGAWADLLLFDPNTVGRGATTRVYDLPAGASRLTTPANGVHGVWVNGVRMADASGLIGDAPLRGQVLRDFTST
jgi:N-acyl-D-amino-acid deacylase